MRGQDRRWWHLGLGLVAGATCGIALGRRLAAARRAPLLTAMQRVLATRWGEAEASALGRELGESFDEMYARRTHFAHPMLRFHLVHLVLPGLALYRTLQDRGLEQEEALLEVEHVLKSVLRRLLQGVALISGLPGSFSIFRGVTHSVIRLGFPPDGWVFEPVEDNERAIAFDYQRCFYLDVLGSCGAPELTSVFCKADDWLAQALPPQIQWERTQTLAGGGDRCDFRWSLRQ